MARSDIGAERNSSASVDTHSSSGKRWLSGCQMLESGSCLSGINTPISDEEYEAKCPFFSHSAFRQSRRRGSGLVCREAAHHEPGQESGHFENNPDKQGAFAPNQDFHGIRWLDLDGDHGDAEAGGSTSNSRASGADQEPVRKVPSLARQCRAHGQPWPHQRMAMEK